MYGYVESSIGFGLMIGPVIGQALFSLLDFEYTFYCTSDILLIPVILTIFLIPNKHNRSAKDRNESMTSSQRKENDKSVTLKMMFTNKRAVMACLSSIFAMVIMLFYDTILSDQLIEIGVSKDLVGNIWCLLILYRLHIRYQLLRIHDINTVRGISCIENQKDLRHLDVIRSCFGLIIAVWPIPPSELPIVTNPHLNLYRSLPMMLVGMVFLGFSCGFIFVPLLPEIIEAIQDKEGIGENEELNDKASGFFNASYAIGCLIAPILGGAFNDAWGFRKTCDIMAMLAAIFGVVYFLINVLPYLVSKHRKS
jgi:MFS family permease